MGKWKANIKTLSRLLSESAKFKCLPVILRQFFDRFRDILCKLVYEIGIRILKLIFNLIINQAMYSLMIQLPFDRIEATMLNSHKKIGFQGYLYK